MRPIPLSIATLYADILQNLSMQELRPGSISTKTVDGKKYLYAVEKHGQTRITTFRGRR